MKKPIAIIFNDVHLKAGNEEDIIKAFNYMVEYASKIGVSNIIFAGDLFDSRSFQRQSVLYAFDKICDKISELNLTLYIFPGNHDKTTYEINYSFIHPFKEHPNIIFNDDVSDIEIDGVKITLIPFWSDEILIPKINSHNGGDILISHFSMQGSMHLGHVVEKPSLTKDTLRKWKKVYLGHYHNHVEITKDIVHLPSFIQNGFGEDNKKGFSVIYNDLSYELIKGKFKEFKKVSIDIDKIILAEIKELINDYKNSSNSIRFEFSGSEEKLRAFDKSIFKDTGIDVKTKFPKKFNFNDIKLDVPSIAESYSKDDVKNTFKKFCEKKGFDYNDGIELLSEFFNKKGL